MQYLWNHIFQAEPHRSLEDPTRADTPDSIIAVMKHSLKSNSSLAFHNPYNRSNVKIKCVFEVKDENDCDYLILSTFYFRTAIECLERIFFEQPMMKDHVKYICKHPSWLTRTDPFHLFFEKNVEVKEAIKNTIDFERFGLCRKDISKGIFGDVYKKLKAQSANWSREIDHDFMGIGEANKSKYDFRYIFQEILKAENIETSLCPITLYELPPIYLPNIKNDVIDFSKILYPPNLVVVIKTSGGQDVINLASFIGCLKRSKNLLQNHYMLDVGEWRARHEFEDNQY